MLSTQQQEYLCAGYIRNNYYYSTPIAINKLIHQFWCEIKSWIFKGNSLNKFLQSKPNDEICHKRFRIKDIPLMATIYPNGLEFSRRSSVIFRIYCDCPLYVKSVQLYIEIYCPQTRSHFRYCEKIKTKNGYIGWTNKYLQLKQCQHQNELEFLYLVDVKSIKYNTVSIQKNNFYKPVKLNKDIVYRWDINILQLLTFKYYKPFQYAFSGLFGDNCWSIWCAPKGFGKYKGFVIGIELYYLPKYMEGIEVSVAMNIQPNIFYGKKVKHISCFGKGYYIQFETCLSIYNIIKNSTDNSGISITCDICCLNMS